MAFVEVAVDVFMHVQHHRENRHAHGDAVVRLAEDGKVGQVVEVGGEVKGAGTTVAR